MRILRWIGLGVLAVLLLAVVLVLAIDVGFQRDRIVRLGLDRVRARLGTDVSLDRVSGRLSRGVVLHALRLGEAGNPLLEIERLEVRWNPISLLSEEEWVAERIRIRGWRLALVRDGRGRWLAMEDLLERLRDDSPDEERVAEAVGGAEATPALRIRRLDLLAGTIDVRLEAVDPTDRGGDDASGALASLQTGAWRAGMRAEGRLEELAIGPGKPLSVASADLSANLVEVEARGPAGQGLDRAELSVRLEGQRLTEARLALEGEGFSSTVEAEGTFDHLDRLDVLVDAASLAALRPWLPEVRPLEGAGRVEGAFEGPPDALTGRVIAEVARVEVGEVRADRLVLDLELAEAIARLREDPFAFEGEIALEANGLDAGGFSPDWLPDGAAQVALDGRVRDEQLELDRLELAVAGLEVRAVGRVRRGGLDAVSADWAVDDVAPWLASAGSGLPLSGRARGRLVASGPFEAPRGTLEVESDGLRFDGRPLGPASLRAASQEVGATVERGPIAVDLSWGPRATPLLEGEATVDLVRERAAFQLRTDRSLVSQLLPEQTGWSFEAETRGVLTREADRIRVELESLAVETDHAHLVLAEPLSLRVEEDLDWSVESEALRVRARTPMGHETQAESGEGAGAETGASMGGEDSPGKVSIRASGTGARPVRLDFTADRIPVGAVAAHLGDLPALAGRLSGDGRWQSARSGEWTSGRADWEGVRVGDVAVDRVGLRWSGRDAAVEANVELGLADARPLRFDAAVAVPDGVDFRTVAAWRRHASIRAELDRLELGIFAPFLPRGVREVTGVASGSIAVSPGRDGWSAVGRLDVEEGGFTVPALRQRFAPVEIRTRLEGGQLRLEEVRIGVPGQGASLQATVDLDPEQGRPIAGELRLDGLVLQREQLVETRIFGALRLAGSFRAPVVRGELELADTRVRVPAADDPILKEIRILARDRDTSLREGSADAEPPIFARADVDLSLSAPSTTRVRGQGAQLFVEGDVRATRRPGEPLRLLGEANVVNGTYTFQGRRFRVRRGTVRLAGDEQVDPLLDVEAHLPVSDIVAIVEVTGRLSAPVVRLRSEPDRSERDVLAYLLFGRPADEIGAAEGARFDAAAARLAAGVAERELREVLGDAMPIDTIEIGADEAGNTSELGFGKYIGPDLYVRYLHVLGDKPADRVGVEYRLNDTFSVGSSVSTTGDAGLDLILRHDF